MAGLRPYSKIIGNRRILKFFLFIIRNDAYTKILRLVGGCLGEFFTKNTLKMKNPLINTLMNTLLMIFSKNFSFVL